MRIWVALVLMVCVAVSGFSQQADDWFIGKPIRDIQFSGLRHVRASDLEGIIESYRGRIFDDELFWELQGRLYALEYFEVLTPSAVPGDPLALGTEVIIRFSVVERPIVSRINIVGNSSIRSNDIRDVISVRTNEVVNQIRLRADETAIVNRYLERGFPDVRVTSRTDTGRDSTIVVTFMIEEGERISISGFVFEGNTVFSDRTLRGQLSLRARGLLNDGAFNEARLIADQAAIIQYYHDRGYIDASLLDTVRTVERDDRGNNNMTITFRIYEGRQYTFGGVTFEGNQIFSTQELSRLINSRVGDVVNARRVESDLQRVAELYFENGYIFNTINRDENRDRERGVVSYTLSIVERGRAHIERISVTGNVKTRDHVILREIPLVAGDVFSRTRVMEGWRNLMNLQYFTMVVPETPPGSADSLMELIFNVEEQPTTDIQLGMTFSGISEPNTLPVSLMAKWTDRNFLGMGNMLGAEIQAAWHTQSFTIDYTHRWIFGLPLSASFDFTFQHTRRFAAMNNTAPFFNGDEDFAFPDGFSSYEEYNAANKIPPNDYLMTYNQFRFSLGASTGYRFPTFLGSLGVGGGVRTGILMNTYDESVFRAFDPVIRDRNNQWTPSNLLWTSVSLDRRDLFFDPSSGYYVVQRFGYYGIFPIELEHYTRTDTRAEYFHTLINRRVTDNFNFRLIFGIHSGVSFIFPHPLSPGSPIIENANRFAVDGMFIGRGWTNEFHVKGNALWTNWAELRIPLVPGILAFDFFLDAAAVKPTPQALFDDFSLDDMRFSLGGQFRFTMPQFPIRLGLAKRFRFEDGNVIWERGSIWDQLDLVFSFSVSTY